MIKSLLKRLQMRYAKYLVITESINIDICYGDLEQVTSLHFRFSYLWHEYIRELIED